MRCSTWSMHLLTPNHKLQICGSPEVIRNTSNTNLRNVAENKLGKERTLHPENPFRVPLPNTRKVSIRRVRTALSIFLFALYAK